MSTRIPYEKVKETVKQALLHAGLSEQDANLCAEIHTQSNADGVESHGVNRLPRLIEYIQKGWVDVNAKPELLSARGVAENYDGHLGLGILNALYCTDRAIALAKEHGIGLVALRNTTHWMRGGTYAWRMAEAGYMGMSWINTESCMPLWGSDEKGVGNNPFCIALPREDGPIVLDMAMSQYAYGKLGVYRLAGKQLPYPGGFDKDGNLTTDPGAIEQTMRILPTGYWKGSGMAVVLDMAAAMLSGGITGSDMDVEDRGSCTGCSQIFIAFDPYLFGDKQSVQAMLNRRVAAANATHPIHEGDRVTCPGERTLDARAKSAQEGVPVDDQIWAQLCALASGATDVKDIASC